MIDNLGLSLSVDGRPHMYLCASCHKCLRVGQLPPEALANHRWFGPQPPELQDLSWIDSIIIARGHLSGSIVRLQKSSADSAYFGIKGHAVIVPEDMTQLLDILLCCDHLFQIMFVSSGLVLHLTPLSDIS